MSGHFALHLCCNSHHNGMFKGVCSGITLGDERLVLVSPWVDRALKCEIAKWRFRLGKEKWWRHFAHNTWTGNWCWDVVYVAAEAAANVLNFAMTRGYKPEVISGRLIEVIRNKQLITAEMLVAEIEG